MAEQRHNQPPTQRRQESQQEQERSGLSRSQPGGSVTSASREESFSPFGMMRRLMEDMDRLFGVGGGLPSRLADPFEQSGKDLAAPPIEAFEEGGNLVLRVDLPGMRSEDLHVQVMGRDLVISGERKQEQREQREGGRFYSERRYGSFERRLTLPAEVQPDKVNATFENGVLEVSIPVPERKPRTIEVKGGAQKRAPGPVH